MSWDALSWAAKQRVGKAADKLILLALAERHNPESGVAYPSVAWLAEFGSLNRKTVIASLDRLEAAGLISDSGQRMGKTLQIKAYSLNLETAPKTEQSQKRNSTDFSRKQSQKRDTDTVREPVSAEAKASTPRVKFAVPVGVQSDQWKAFKAQRKKPLNDRAYTLVCNKLRELAEDGYPPGEMIDLAIERGWETVFKPRKFGNERSDPNPTTSAVQRILGVH